VTSRLTPERRRWALVALLGALCFAAITWRVADTGTFPGDQAFLRLARRVHDPTLDRVLEGLCDVAVVLVGAAILWGSWIAATSAGPTRRKALVLVAAVIGVLVAKLITNELVHRPSAGLHGDDEFPSGHAATTLALGAELLILWWAAARRGWLIAAAVVLVGGVGVARVLLEAHFASDVLAGWAVAIAVVGVLAATIDTSR
jgi:membrane-associated phospholipid phosphatase